MKVEGSPTFVLPSGKQVSYLGLPHVELDEKQHACLVAVHAAPCSGQNCLDLYRQMFAEARQERASRL
jgi:hypothetical protein